MGEAKCDHPEWNSYSSDATGQTLGISTGTVRIHRRNIYTKLGISSQRELFARFLASVTSGDLA